MVAPFIIVNGVIIQRKLYKLACMLGGGDIRAVYSNTISS